MRLSATNVILAVLFLAVALGGCAAKREQLVPKSASVPAGIDLSGQWRLVGNDVLTEKSARSDALVAVFLETGVSLRVTQTDDGLFISFDRAIVEEYRFGELREISVGPVVADRASGWDTERYFIETLDADGVKLVETWGLVKNGTSLMRTVRILDRQTRVLDVRQEFKSE